MNRPGLYKSAGRHTVNLGDGLDTAIFEEWFDKDGFQQLVCKCYNNMKRQWCDHQELLVKLELDVKDPDLINGKTNVVVYANPWLVVPCFITPKQAGYNDVSVFIADRFEPIGFKLWSEGSLVLRQLIVEWLTGVPEAYPDRMKCTSLYHSQGSSSLELLFDLKDRITPEERKKLLIDIWDLYATHHCRKCNDITPMYSEDAKPAFAKKGSKAF